MAFIPLCKNIFELVSTIYSVAKGIKEKVKQVSGNRKKCQRLSKRIQALLPQLNGNPKKI
jgi:hypothetical protein